MNSIQMGDEGIQLLCAGDFHFGRHPTRIPDRLDGPEFSPRTVWQDIVRVAIEKGVDAVVLTGDIADRENRYFEAYGAFEAGVIDLEDAGIPVVMVAGNHDSEFLPRMVEDIGLDNLHLLGAGGTWERWSLEKNGATLYISMGGHFRSRMSLRHRWRSMIFQKRRMHRRLVYSMRNLIHRGVSTHQSTHRSFGIRLNRAGCLGISTPPGFVSSQIQ